MRTASAASLRRARRVSLFGLTLALAVSACSVESAPDLEPGTFEYRIVHRAFWDIAPEISMDADGGFTGHRGFELWNCQDRVSAIELQEIAELFNQANVLQQGDTPDRCVDNTTIDFEIDVVRGVNAGWSNRFHLGECPEVSYRLGTALSRALAPLDAAACDGCPIVTEDDECYGQSVGSDRFCVGSARAVCDEATAGDVIDCPGSLECEPAAGWVPAVRWNIESATLYRRQPSLGNSVTLALEVDVDNRGDASFPLGPFDFVILSDPASGEAVPIWGTSGLCSISVVHAEPRSRKTYAISMSCGNEPGSPIDVATALAITLTERPYEVSPPGPEIDVQIIDGG